MENDPLLPFPEEEKSSIREPSVKPEPAAPVAEKKAAAPKVALDVKPLPYSKDQSFGNFLKQIRLYNKLDIDTISRETKIKALYLEALENEDLDRLPQLVYVIGYIRKLCVLYKVSTLEADELTKVLREQLECELPEDINKSIVDRESSEENEKKIKQLMFIIVSSILLIVAVLVFGGVMIFSGCKHRAEAAAAGTTMPVMPQGDKAGAFSDALLIDLQGPVKLEKTDLPRK